MEKRQLGLAEKVELREDENKQPAGITGYAAVFYDGTPETEYEIVDGLRERIMPGAFDRAMNEGHDVRGLFNHNADLLLGRTKSGTCRLSVDSRGLKYDIPLDPSDPDHLRVAAKLKRGDVNGSSFCFVAQKQDWKDEGDMTYREVRDVDLYDVGPVVFPAYTASSSALRSIDGAEQAKAEADAWKASKEQSENELRDYHHGLQEKNLEQMKTLIDI